jgi:hypothetical protein
MSEAFWWYVLAGFLLGFSFSTLWEWIYFRRRRMNIRDRRIAELEATVRAYTAAASAADAGAATDDWAEPTFHSPGIYLETEEAPATAPAPETVSAAQGSSSTSAVVATAPIINGAPPAAQATRSASTRSAPTTVTSAPAGFQSLAVQQPPPPMSAARRTGAAVENSHMGDVLAAPGAATAMPRKLPATRDQTPAAMAPEAGAYAVAHTSVYVNGVSGPAMQAEADNRAPDLEHHAITHAEIGALVSSINELIDTVSQEQKAVAVASTAPEAPSLAVSADPDATRVSGRAESVEHVLVRIVQSFVQFIRQLRQIMTGAEAPRPEVRPALAVAPEDDLTRIAGLSREHAARLRAAGVTTYARLAALSPDDLRMITLTPDEPAVDPAQWQTQARQLAIKQQAGAHT